MAKTRKNLGGRPPAGPGGEKVREYKHQLTSRLRGDTFHTITNITAVTNVSYRALITDAVELYLAQRVSKADRDLIERSGQSAQQHCPRCQSEQPKTKRAR